MSPSFFFFFNNSRYELAILQNKLKGTPVVPVYVGSIDNNNTTTANIEFGFTSFDPSDLDPSKFPKLPHSRGKDLQFFIDETRYSSLSLLVPWLDINHIK